MVHQNFKPKSAVLQFLPLLSYLYRISAITNDEQKELSDLALRACQDPFQWMKIRSTLLRIQKSRQVVSDLVREGIADAIQQTETILQNI